MKKLRYSLYFAFAIFLFSNLNSYSQDRKSDDGIIIEETNNSGKVTNDIPVIAVPVKEVTKPVERKEKTEFKAEVKEKEAPTTPGKGVNDVETIEDANRLKEYREGNPVKINRNDSDAPKE